MPRLFIIALFVLAKYWKPELQHIGESDIGKKNEEDNMERFPGHTTK